MWTNKVFPGGPGGRSPARSVMRDKRAVLKRWEKRKEREKKKNFDSSGEKVLEIK